MTRWTGCITADNGNGTADDRTYAYDDIDNMVFNSGLCAANPNLVYPASVAPPPPPSLVNLTDTYPAQMSATSNSSYAALYPPAKAIDNNASTYASVYNLSGNGWLKLDMGASFQVSRVKVVSGPNVLLSTLTGAVVSLRDAAGATLYSFPALAGAGSGVVFTLDLPAPVNARSIYVASPNGGGIAEMDVFNQPPAPPPPVAVARPHAPTSICGTPVTYDANGNTLTYDADGAGAIQPRAFTYDGENRPLSITQNANATNFAYAPDGERASKAFGGNTTSFLGNDTELLVNGANPTGLLTSNLHPDVKREGAITSWAHKDHLASNRL